MYQISPLRSFLFVPGDKPDRYEKAANSGCDSMIIDLEDAVSERNKDSAREDALNYFSTSSDNEILRMLRINSLKTKHGLKDLLTLCETESKPDGIVIPMIDSSEEIILIDSILGNEDSSLIYFVVIETLLGLENVELIATASENIKMLGFGSADFTSQSGSDLSWDSLLLPRSRIVNAAALAGVIAVDGVWPEINDDEGLINETKRIAGLGFQGKIAIHPKQIKGIHGGFEPSPHELEFAREVVAAYEASNGGAIKVKGKMIDEPLVISAKHTISRASKFEGNK